MKQTQSAVPTNPSAASLGRDRSEKSEITDIGRFLMLLDYLAFIGAPGFYCSLIFKERHRKCNKRKAQCQQTQAPLL